MPDVPVRVLAKSPPLPLLYVRTALSAVPGASLLMGRGHRPRNGDVPDLRLELHDVTVDADHLAAYREVCRYPPRPGLPATYLHVLAFPLHLVLMTKGGFPFAPMGLVHVANRIEQVRPIGIDESLDLAVWAEDIHPHTRGRTVTVVSEGSVRGEVVWRDETVLLKRGPGDPDAPDVQEPLPSEASPSGPARWPLAGNLSRRYAAVSGDRNPIHLYDLTAKPFGFRRHIAHGMWTKARCLAALDNRLSDAFRVEVAFRKPIELPGTALFGARQLPGRLDFDVHGTSGSTHLAGCVTTS
ncbi:MAG TPA: MaoC/PaaZ C-terminal domain-containing protein [Nocardioidaceae bacterium]